MVGIILLFAAVALAGCGSKSTTTTPPAALTITTTASSMPTAYVGQPYQTTVTATGGVPPYSWSLVSSSIAGTTLTPAGVLNLTPQSLVPGSIVVQVTDSAGTQSAFNLQIGDL